MNSGSLLLKYVLTSGKKPGSEEVAKWKNGTMAAGRESGISTYINIHVCIYL